MTHLPPDDTPRTATEQRGRVKAPNRNIALLLLGVVVLFLAAAFGVAILVVYGRF